MSSPFPDARAASPTPGLATRTGARMRRGLGQPGTVAWLAWNCVKGFLTLKPHQWGVVYQVTRMQVRFTAWDAIPLTLLTALLLGGMTLLQVFGQLSALGVESMLSRLMGQLVIRELGPLLVGVIVLGRSATAIAAEMASIKLNGEVDALFALGVNPVQYLLVPRVLGGILSVFSLIVLFDVAALLGGFFLAWLVMPILSLRFYLDALAQAIGWQELAITLSKGVVFGMAIPLLCTSIGLRVERSITEIPQAVTKAAVASLLTVLLAGAFLSVLIYG